MKKLPLKLEKRLQKRKEVDSFRKLLPNTGGIDLYSNDYLGFAISQEILANTNRMMKTTEFVNGATGSRLLSGNHSLFKKTENLLSGFHNAQAALIFNSGYDANIGFFSSVPQKNDIILYDEFSHASIRDGLKMCPSRKYKYRHNDLRDLKLKVRRFSEQEDSDIYVVTESVFSMDGDSPDLNALVEMAEESNLNLIIDEAHATGVFGKKGQGLLSEFNLESKVFARLHTFGKAMGCHGAAILGCRPLIDYLVNFSRSLIYTTALSPHAVATIYSAYRCLEDDPGSLNKLKSNIEYFQTEIIKNGLQGLFIKSESAIQSCIIPGNSEVKGIAAKLNEQGFDIRPILSPSVPEGKERLRFCIHSYNSSEEITKVLKLLANFVTNS